MQALFIGHTYIDVTFLTDRMPTGDEKHVASAYAISFGGNAVTAAFCCAKLGIAPDLLATVADDWLGRMFLDMTTKFGINIHAREVKTSSLSFIMPKDGKRAIVRCRDDDYLGPFPSLDLSGCRALHVDGHQPDAAIYYAKLCRGAGDFHLARRRRTALEYARTPWLLDVAIVAERLCEQMGYEPGAMLDYLKSRGCRLGGVTLGKKACSGMMKQASSERCRRLPYLSLALSTVAEPETSSTALIFIPTSPIRRGIGSHICVLRKLLPRTRCNILAMKPACRHCADIAAVEREFAMKP